MTEAKPGFIAQLKSFPATFYVANTMEIFERMAWYGFFAVSSLYITGPVETGALASRLNSADSFRPSCRSSSTSCPW